MDSLNIVSSTPVMSPAVGSTADHFNQNKISFADILKSQQAQKDERTDSVEKSAKASGVNLNAVGGKELTQEQIEKLRKKYDVTNMSMSELDSLYAELTQMDVISYKDYCQSKMCIGSTEEAGICKVSELPKTPELTNPLQFYRYMSKKEAGYISKDNKPSVNDFIQQIVDTHTRLADILEQLKRAE